MNSYMIDIVFVIFLILMAILGYIKGFVTRLYDFIGMIIVLFLAYFLATPISSILKIYKYDASDVFASMVGSIINRMIVFIILLIGLTILKWLIGIVVKPLLKGMMETFKVTSFMDKLLGVVLSVIEGVLISYVVMTFIVIPFQYSDMETINQTLFAKHVVNLVPDVTQQVMTISDGFQELDSPNSLETLTRLMLTANDFNLIDDQQTQKIFEENIQKQLEKETIQLTSSQKQQIEDILDETGYNKNQIKSILLKINVSGE